MVLITTTSLAVLVFFARQGIFGWAQTVAPGLSLIGFGAITYFALSNFPAITGTDSAIINGCRTCTCSRSWSPSSWPCVPGASARTPTRTWGGRLSTDLTGATVRFGYAETPLGQLHYAEAGSGGTPVICLHQTPRSHDEFAELMPLVGPHHRIIAMDMYGFGQSAKPEGPQTIEQYAQVRCTWPMRSDSSGSP